MKTIIVYGSKYGSAKLCSDILKDNINGETELLNLKTNAVKSLASYDNIIIGGSIYIGKIQKEVSKFIKENKAEILEKNFGIFICCMAEGDAVAEQIKNNFDNELLEKALFADTFGGKFDFSKMNFIERKIVKKVSGIAEDSYNIDEEKIEILAGLINNLF